MKNVSIFLAISLFGFASWSNGAQIYKSACTTVSEIKMDVEGRGISGSWNRQIEIRGSEFVITKGYFVDGNCEKPLRKHLYLGQLIDGRDANEKYTDLTSAFVVRDGQMKVDTALRLNYFLVDEKQVLPAIVTQAAQGLQNAAIYDAPRFTRSAHRNDGTISQSIGNRITISADGQEAVHLNRVLSLQK